MCVSKGLSVSHNPYRSIFKDIASPFFFATAQSAFLLKTLNLSSIGLSGWPERHKTGNHSYFDFERYC